jgi:uncharacterized protein DUF2381
VTGEVGHVFAALLRWVPVLAVRVGVEAWAEPREPEELRAVLALVTDASEADARGREPLPRKPEQAEPREPSDFVKLLLSGALEPGETLVGKWLQATVFSEGVEMKPPWFYRLGEQRVVALLLHNPEGAAPWAPRVVRLTSESLGPEPVTLSAHMRVPQLLPGESGWVVLEWPLKKEAAAFRLEVRESGSGRGVRVERDGH